MPAISARTPRSIIGYEDPEVTYDPSTIYDELAPSADARHISLLGAVIRRAMIDYCLVEEHESAKDWFESTSMRPFSFRWIATHLHPTDPEGLKERVLKFLTSDTPEVVQHRIGDTITF